eukprot:206014-Amphidinium_carterae.1
MHSYVVLHWLSSGRREPSGTAACRAQMFYSGRLQVLEALSCKPSCLNVGHIGVLWFVNAEVLQRAACCTAARSDPHCKGSVCVCVFVVLCGCCEVRCDSRPRVLVTGFADWHGTQDQSQVLIWESARVTLCREDNVLRCRDNPSCRLLVGEACEKPSIDRAGSLAKFLREEAPDVDWCVSFASVR